MSYTRLHYYVATNHVTNYIFRPPESLWWPSCLGWSVSVVVRCASALSCYQIDIFKEAESRFWTNKTFCFYFIQCFRKEFPMINQILRYKQDRDHNSLLIRKQGLYRVFVNFSSIYGKQLFIKLIFYQLVRFDHQTEKNSS